MHTLYIWFSWLWCSKKYAYELSAYTVVCTYSTYGSLGCGAVRNMPMKFSAYTIVCISSTCSLGCGALINMPMKFSAYTVVCTYSTYGSLGCGAVRNMPMNSVHIQFYAHTVHMVLWAVVL